jgi:septal ring factor EnvC (AmiA/AmiB activator)
MARARLGRVLRIVVPLLSSALVALPSTAAPGAADEAQLRELRGRIERLQKELAEAEKSGGEAADQLKESSRAVSQAQRGLFELARRRRVLEEELRSLAGRDRDTRAGIAEHEALAGKLLRLQYQQGATDRLRLALEGRDPATVARHLAYYGYIQRARADLIAELRAKAEELAALERDARARRDELVENQKEQARQARVLEKERAARAAVATKLAGEITRGRREIGRLKKDEARLAKLVEEIARALATRPAPVKPRGTPVEEVADASLSRKPFRTLKGRLKLPVRGELMNRYGATREQSGAQWKGLFIRSATGEIVRAVADGRVVYADWLRGFGNLLILDHGSGFMSLYAYNEGLIRQVGESVRSGEPIAHVGATGGREDSGLYFELRREGKPFDPMAWVAQ